MVVECPEPLLTLFRSLEGVEAVVLDGEKLPPCDYQIPMLTLPMAFGTVLETIPVAVPYLHAAPELRQKWRGLLGEKSGALRVGLVWAGSPSHPEDRSRSISLRQLLPLFEVPNVEFFSLQIGPGATQIAALSPPPPLIDHTKQIFDLADTAAIVSELDLVIAVDTSIVHLAGALGRPVWTLLAFSPDWRWLLERADSPWYPSMRLFRQPKPGDWAPVVARVAEQLQQLATSPT